MAPDRLRIYHVSLPYDYSNMTWQPDYDTFDSFVIIAASAEEARYTYPGGGQIVLNSDDPYTTWPTLDEDIRQLDVIEIGIAHEDAEPGVVVASFNAG